MKKKNILFLLTSLIIITSLTGCSFGKKAKVDKEKIPLGLSQEIVDLRETGVIENIDAEENEQKEEKIEEESIFYEIEELKDVKELPDYVKNGVGTLFSFEEFNGQYDENDKINHEGHSRCFRIEFTGIPADIQDQYLDMYENDIGLTSYADFKSSTEGTFFGIAEWGEVNIMIHSASLEVFICVNKDYIPQKIEIKDQTEENNENIISINMEETAEDIKEDINTDNENIDEEVHDVDVDEINNNNNNELIKLD